MRVRAYTEADFEAVRAMHAAQGFGYALPDLSDPLFLVRNVLEEDSRPRTAAFLRLNAEAYLLADPREGSPRERWQWLLTLHEAMRREARHAALPTCRRFCRPPWRAPSGGALRRSDGVAILGHATQSSCSAGPYAVVLNAAKLIKVRALGGSTIARNWFPALGN